VPKKRGETDPITRKRELEDGREPCTAERGNACGDHQKKSKGGRPRVSKQGYYKKKETND